MLKDLILHPKAEDEVDQHKAQVTSTLDRLARKVAAEKQKRADKCKAFKVILSQCVLSKPAN